MKWLRRGGREDAHRDEPAVAAAAAAAPLAAPIAAWRVLAAILLCALNVAFSGLLLLQHHGQTAAVSAVEQLCGPEADSGCAAVARSRWSQVAGVPVAAVGVVFYAGVALLLLLGMVAGAQSRAAAAALALLALALALAVDLVLLGIQAVAIRAFCALCLVTYALNLLAGAALLPARRDGSVVGEAVTRREGRLALTAWVVAALAVTAGVAIAEYGLARGEAASAAGVLGGPSSGSPSTAGGDMDRYREEARAAGDQARRLQEILDDPEKLERYFAERAEREFEQAPVHALDLASVPLKGPAAAPIKVVEYSDFLCPYCRNVAAAFNGYLPGSGGRVGVYFKHYPLDAECNPNVRPSVHAGACLLALGGICAQDQERFWPYHDRVFGVQHLANPQPQDVIRMAAEVGADAAAFQQCLGSSSARDRLAAQVAEAHRAGVNSTPTLFINGKRLPRLADFLATVDKEAARLGMPPLPQQQGQR